MYVARSSDRLPVRLLAEVVSSSDVVVYKLRMADWIWELRDVWPLAKSGECKGLRYGW